MCRHLGGRRLSRPGLLGRRGRELGLVQELTCRRRAGFGHEDVVTRRLPIACNTTLRMATLQVRNVPEDLHRRLKARAAESGGTLSEYVLEELRDLSHRPTMREWLAEVSGLGLPS